MAPKYKNDLAKCYGLLKFDLNWKVTCEDIVQFSNALERITTNITSEIEDIHPVPKINGRFDFALILVLDPSDEQTLYDTTSKFLEQYGK
ncbi:hypothetical protein D915_005567 [Fasciola hepatica]|uniref:Uncharacterized protein n=1 Tax=Fasciola hepatica TaxID=6192 RepID=A0A4E0R8P1_FASHE|nr:hypothetical protein D915_005567 [Fasciola hepatica]